MDSKGSKVSNHHSLSDPISFNSVKPELLHNIPVPLNSNGIFPQEINLNSNTIGNLSINGKSSDNELDNHSSPIQFKISQKNATSSHNTIIPRRQVTLGDLISGKFNDNSKQLDPVKGINRNSSTYIPK